MTLCRGVPVHEAFHHYPAQETTTIELNPGHWTQPWDVMRTCVVVADLKKKKSVDTKVMGALKVIEGALGAHRFAFIFAIFELGLW